MCTRDLVHRCGHTSMRCVCTRLRRAHAQMRVSTRSQRSSASPSPPAPDCHSKNVLETESECQLCSWCFSSRTCSFLLLSSILWPRRNAVCSIPGPREDLRAGSGLGQLQSCYEHRERSVAAALGYLVAAHSLWLETARLRGGAPVPSHTPTSTWGHPHSFHCCHATPLVAPGQAAPVLGAPHATPTS